jgi:hypothetical protein
MEKCYMFTKRIDCLDDSWSKRDLATKRNGRPLSVFKTLLNAFGEVEIISKLQLEL